MKIDWQLVKAWLNEPVDVATVILWSALTFAVVLYGVVLLFG